MQPSQNIPKEVIENVERNIGTVNPEQVFLTAMFAKQLQADLSSIKRASVGSTLKVPDVDLSKVLPSNIQKTFKQSYTVPPPLPIIPPSAVTSDQTPPVEIPQSLGTLQAPLPSKEVNGQMEFDLNKKVRYEDIMDAIEKNSRELNILKEKINVIYDYIIKKKLKKTLDGTQN